jgi:hypothetical protein
VVKGGTVSRIIETPGDSSQYDRLVSTMQKRFGKKQGLFLSNRIAKAIRQANDLCISNFRLARKGNSKEVARYKMARSNGC